MSRVLRTFGEAMAADAAAQLPSIYLLSDHLDAALAMGEDLLTEKVALADPVRKLTPARLARQSRELAEFLSTVRTLELSLTSRLMQARRRCEELKRHETRLRPLIALFAAGTTPLADAAAELGDTTTRDFQTGDTSHAFLRSRGLIARDTAGLAGLTQLAVTEDYLVAGRIRLGTLLDLVATFLDALDLLFDLYADGAKAEASADGLSGGVAGTRPAESSRAT
jgi:hypothetical protein